MMKNLKTYVRNIPLEGYIWILSFVILALINIDSDSHFTICPLSNLGISFCPGCGLGKSIHYLLNFNFIESFYAHPLGGAAFLVLLHRIFLLLKRGMNMAKSKTS
jgi:hypothetical protein